VIRSRHDNAETFEQYLIEEQDVDGVGLSNGMGFVSFLEQISRDILEYMK
jgi:hypothetical protein